MTAQPFVRCALAPGHWDSLDWKIHRTRSCGAPLLPFVRINDECVQHPSARRTLSSCLVRNATLLRLLENASILLLGDSTSAQLLDHACQAFQSKPHSFVPVPKDTSELSRYAHRLHSLDNHRCWLLRGDGGGSRLPIGSFSHYGATGPPYWVYAYPLAPWLGNTSVVQVRENVPGFTDGLGAGPHPTLVVAGSGYWDISSWWANEANFSKTFQVNERHIQSYVAGVGSLVREVRRVFPESTVLWRTMHPGRKHSITPPIVHAQLVKSGAYPL